jgi:transposase
MAYSEDFRQKIVEAYMDGEGTVRGIAERFKVGKDTVRRYLKLYREKNSLEKKPHGGGRQSILSQDDGYEKLRKLVEENKTLYDREYCKLLKERYGIQIGKSSLNRALQKLALSKKSDLSCNRTAQRRRERKFLGLS